MPLFVLKSPIVRHGIAYRAGASIELTEADGQSLADAGIVHPAETKARPKGKTKPKAKPPEPTAPVAPVAAAKPIDAQEIQ